MTSSSQLQLFSHAHDFSVSGSSFIQNNNNYSLPNPLERLYAHVASNAFHNSSTRFDPPRCHPRTRTAIIKHLHNKILGEIEPEIPITRLSGPAGAGKSAIMQTIAELCDKEGRNVASFFFWKSDPTRNHPGRFVATICYQLLRLYPRIEPMVKRVLAANPLIFKTTTENQLRYLVGEPLELLFRDWLMGHGDLPPCLIIIDGLDECLDKPRRCNLIHAIAHMFIKHPLPLTIFIATRPEIDIMGAFNQSPIATIFKPMNLDAEYSSYTDISLFLEESFSNIVATHPRAHLIPNNWPDREIISKLCRKSSGQFIFASVVIKYISQPNQLPHRQLDIIMGLRPASSNLPFVELDAIYMHLMLSLSPEDVDFVKSVLKLTQIDIDQCTTEDIAGILHKDIDDIHIAMTPLLSIVTIHDYIHIYHASFGDFLSDKQRSDVFFLGNEEEQILDCSKLVLNALTSNPSGFSPFLFLHLIWHYNDMKPEEYKHIQCTIESYLSYHFLDTLWSSHGGVDITECLVEICQGKFSQIVKEHAVKILRQAFNKYLAMPSLTALLIEFAVDLNWEMTRLALLRHSWDLDITLLGLSRHDTVESWSILLVNFLDCVFDCTLKGRQPRFRRRHIDNCIIFSHSQHLYTSNPSYLCHSSRKPYSLQMVNVIHEKNRPRLWRTRRLQHGRNSKFTKQKYAEARDKCHRGEYHTWEGLPLLHLLRYCSTSPKLLAFLKSEAGCIPLFSRWTWSIFNAVQNLFSTKRHHNEVINIKSVRSGYCN